VEPTKIFTIEGIENKKLTPSLHLITFEKPADFNYIPGQYVEFSFQGEENQIPLAISNHPEDDHLEFIIKKSGDLATRVCTTGPGVPFQISEPKGPGFPPEKLQHKTIYLITHGSGISAIKPVIEEIRKKRENYGPVRFLYGVKSPDEIPFKNLFRDWMGSIELYDIISDKIEDKKLWNGEQGYVQDLVKKIKPEPDNAVAIVIGSNEMEKSVREILKEAGFSEEQILKNY